MPRARGLKAAVPSCASLRRPGLDRGAPQSSAENRPRRLRERRSTAESAVRRVQFAVYPPPGER